MQLHFRWIGMLIFSRPTWFPLLIWPLTPMVAKFVMVHSCHSWVFAPVRAVIKNGSSTNMASSRGRHIFEYTILESSFLQQLKSLVLLWALTEFINSCPEWAEESFWCQVDWHLQKPKPLCFFPSAFPCIEVIISAAKRW